MLEGLRWDRYKEGVWEQIRGSIWSISLTLSKFCLSKMIGNPEGEQETLTSGPTQSL